MDISPDPKELYFDKHIEYIVEHEKDKDDFVRDGGGVGDELGWLIIILAIPFNQIQLAALLYSMFVIYMLFQMYCMTEFARMSGVYWGVTALDLMGHLNKLDREEILEFIRKCQCPKTGGIAPCEGHDPHILYTLSAIQVSRVVRYVLCRI